MSGYKIKVGDIVTVNFNNSMNTLCHAAYVRYMPSQIGDSWIFEDRDTGKVHYVSEGCTVSKI